MVIGQILGAEQTVAWLGARREAVQLAMRTTVRSLALQLTAYVKSNKLTGQVLHVRSGRLRGHITFRVQDRGDIITGLVGTNVIYARIHEFGGHTKPHIIVPRNAKALHWGSHFAKIVHHPGSNMPERSFLRSSLREMEAVIKAELSLAMREALK